MRILISPVSFDEAVMVVAGNADIVDIKNVLEGSLGAQMPWVPKQVVTELGKNHKLTMSVALGDLAYKPGTAALAAYGAACLGANYIKAGLYGMSTYEEAFAVMDAVTRAIRMVSNDILSVGAGYADYRRFGGVSYKDIVSAVKDAKADVAMLDTALKHEGNLFDAMSGEEIKEFINLGHEAGLLVALAGSVKKEHIKILADWGADIVGVRGAVCPDGDRQKGITQEHVEAFMKFARACERQVA